ncbi:MAG: 1-(5-phosphoribosyl)-5-[(5-phosphoribosylamino)methylideneamino]imidazole-4-carboxamide isomerase [Nitrosopumilaceae archaeon]|nr:1-(5-phosphoribosyl)-5-[(5-phosphoribosylamino)methylideneamino]imidazole-4-carboxamide isomerase [Nitrosopumilaceae archaeon]
MKIIPAIDLMDGNVVRLYKGDPEKKTVYSDDPVSMAQKWQSAGADMIHVVDLDATLSLGSNKEIISEIVRKVPIPIQVAGGLRDKSIIDEFLRICHRVVVGTLAFKDKDLLQQLHSEYGSSKIAISVDHKDGKIVTHGWQKGTDINLIDSMKEFLQMGFTEFLITNVSLDGTLQGPDLKYLQKACNLEKSHVIASGGISNVKDVAKIKEINPYGVILGKALYENKLTIQEAKKHS